MRPLWQVFTGAAHHPGSTAPSRSIKTASRRCRNPLEYALEAVGESLRALTCPSWQSQKRARLPPTA
jgi:hypothetical protein